VSEGHQEVGAHHRTSRRTPDRIGDPQQLAHLLESVQGTDVIPVGHVVSIGVGVVGPRSCGNPT
jgi:hypothetical protein